jgi:hypothetical protein
LGVVGAYDSSPGEACGPRMYRQCWCGSGLKLELASMMDVGCQDAAEFASSRHHLCHPVWERGPTPLHVVNPPRRGRGAPPPPQKHTQVMSYTSYSPKPVADGAQHGREKVCIKEASSNQLRCHFLHHPAVTTHDKDAVTATWCSSAADVAPSCIPFLGPCRWRGSGSLSQQRALRAQHPHPQETAHSPPPPTYCISWAMTASASKAARRSERSSVTAAPVRQCQR